MVFQNGKTPLIGLVFLLASGCTGSPTKTDPAGTITQDDPLQKDAKTTPVCKRWAMPFNATISYLSLSGNGKHTLISTGPIQGRGTRQAARLRLIESTKKGSRVLWSRELKQTVRSQDQASDGKLLAITTFDSILHVLRENGRTAWEQERFGKPYLLPKTSRLVLFNDDDADPQTAFYTYGLGGKLLGAAKAPSETIDLFISADETKALVTLQKNKAALFSTDGTFLGNLDLDGDAVAASFDLSSSNLLYVLTRTEPLNGAETLTAYKMTTEGSPISFEKLWNSEIPAPGPFETMRASKNTIFLYGNSRSGQVLAGYANWNGTLAWRHYYQHQSSYTSPIALDADRGIFSVAVDEFDATDIIHVVGINSDGRVFWDAPVRADDGLYGFDLSKDGKSLVVAASDGNLSMVSSYAIGCSVN